MTGACIEFNTPSSTNNIQKEIATNVELLNRAITAVDGLSKNLKFVVLPTGTKVPPPLSWCFVCGHSTYREARPMACI